MKKYIGFALIAVMASSAMVSCTDTYLGIEQVKTHSGHPEKLTINAVIPLSGGLDIKFTLPTGNPDIAQVVASYINKRGQKMEFKASRYSSSILVEGLTGTEEVNVELVCIDASGNVSDVTLVKATPLLSPIEVALQTLIIEPAFGGVRVDWKNKSGLPFIIHVLTEDYLQKDVISLSEDASKAIYNTDSVNTHAYVRQYPSTEQKFGFVISDKWGNRTDTVINFITPYKEEKIDFTKVKEVTFFNPTLFNGTRDYGLYGENASTGLQNDGNSHAAGNRPQTIFNGSRAGNLFYGYKFVKNFLDPDITKRVIVNDFYLTFDLNMTVKLSRVKIFPRTAIVYTYTRSSVKRFKIWGTNNDNTQKWAKFPETWTLIGEYVGKTPVNLASLTPEEISYFNENQEFSIAEDNVNPAAQPTKSFRFMRLQLMETYNKNEAFYTINEFEMYGDIK